MMFLWTRTLLLSLFALCACAQWPNPEPINGTRPDQAHDPSVVRRVSDNKLFLFGTGGNISLYTADTMYGPWTKSPVGALDGLGFAASGYGGSGAPQAYLVDDTYYLYYSKQPAGTYHNATIWVASSKSMEVGTWTSEGQLPIQNSTSYNVLDASLLVVNGSDSADQYYLSFGSYYQDIYQIELSDPTTIKTGAQPVHLEYNSTNHINGVSDHPSEGSFQLSWPVNGTTKYFLFFSSGACCDELDAEPAWGDAYKVMVCRSDEPSGPYVDKDGKSCLTENGGTEILGSHDDIFAPGGEGVIWDDEIGSLVLYYHYVPYNSTTGVYSAGAPFGWNKLQIGTDGWPSLVS